MYWHQIGSTLLTVAIFAGCGTAPIDSESENDVNQVADVGHTTEHGPVTNVDYLDGAHPDSIYRCKKEAETGSRIMRTVCGPQKDNIDLLHVIGGRGGPKN